MKIGFGYDIHKLVAGDGIILGGIKIPFNKKLYGHSDADVLTHAICDALLGAMGEQDIGVHFPDTNIAYKNISSMKLLLEIRKMLLKEGYSIVNLDTTIILEAPKLSEYKLKIKNNIAKHLDITPDDVNIKATTQEGIGWVGKGEAIVSFCVVLISKE